MDERLRRMARESAMSGEGGKAELIVNKFRAGEVTKKDLHIATILGDSAATELLDSIGEPEAPIGGYSELMNRLEAFKNREVSVRLAREVYLNYIETQKNTEAYKEHREKIESVLQLVEKWLSLDGHKERQNSLNDFSLDWPAGPFPISENKEASILHLATIELYQIMNPVNRGQHGVKSLQQLIGYIASNSIAGDAGEQAEDTSDKLSVLNEARLPVIDWILKNKDNSKKK